MADSLLNLNGLRGDTQPAFPREPFGFERILQSLGPARFSRRNLLQFAAASAATSAVDLVPSHHTVSVRARGKCLCVFVDGLERWRIDPERFSGAPVLGFEIDKTQTIFKLRGALFPGTEIPASVSGSIIRQYGIWLLNLAWDLGGFKAQVPLVDWLLRGVRAASWVHLGELNVWVGSSERFLIKGSAAAAFSPPWALRLDGRSVAQLEGFGPNIISNSVHVSLADQTQPTALRVSHERRSIVSLDGVGQNWNVEPNLPYESQWNVSTESGAFNFIQIEFGESQRRKRETALVARSDGDNRRRVYFHPSQELRSLDGKEFELPLDQPKYAVAFGDGVHESALVGNLSETPKWASLKGVALQFGKSKSNVPFELVTRNGELLHLRAAPSLLQMAAPLGDSTIAAGPIPICGTPDIRLSYHPAGFLHRLKCWLGLCNDAELCVPLHGSRLSVLRHTDLLRVDFEFINLSLHAHHGRSWLVRTDSTGTPVPEDTDLSKLPEALIIVYFPPQNIYEEAFFEGVAAKDKCDPDFGNSTEEEPHRPPVQARISGPSRLAFQFECHHIPYTLESLLNFSRFEMKLVSTAVAAGERPLKEDSKPVRPSEHETALEIPYRLFLSPNRFAGWANRRMLPKRPAKEPVELWHTRLGVRRKDGSIDEREASRKTLRAVWSAEYTQDPCLPEKTSANLNQPFRGSLSPRDRVEIVELTSNFALRDPADETQVRPYRADPVRADLLMLSALGAWLKSTGQWTPPLTINRQALTIELWKHVATMGRDHYVRVEYKGYLMPFGYPCTLVKITERKFVCIKDVPGRVAYLRQRLFIIVKREDKTYPAVGQQDGGRKWPFKEVIFEKNYTTPNLDEPTQQDEFWPQTREPGAKVSKDVIFRYKLEDRDGTVHDCSSPLKFVDATVAYSECTADDLKLKQGVPCQGTPGDRCGVVIPAGNKRLQCAIEEYNSDLNSTRRTIALHGEKVAYAPTRKPGDTQFETACIRLNTEAQSQQFKCTTLFADDQAPIYPAVQRASVTVASITQLSGSAALTEIEYEDTYIRSGFEEGANRGEVFAKFSGGPVALTFGGNAANTDKAGGIVTPNAGVVGLSRRIGPVGGSSETSLAVTAKANFDASDFFKSAIADGRILGGPKLTDIIRPFASGIADALDQAPRILRRALSKIEATLEKEARTFHDAAAPIRKTIQDGIGNVAVLKARFQPQVDVISADLDALDKEIDPDPNHPQSRDDFKQLEHDEKLIELQGRILNGFRTLAAQVQDTLNHPQVLLQAEIDILLQQASDFLASKLSAQLAELKKLLIQAGSKALDKATQAVFDLVLQGISAVAQSQTLQDQFSAVQSGLSKALQDFPSAATIDNTVLAAAQIIDRFNKVREQIRQTTDLAHVVVTDIATVQKSVRDLARVGSADFQAERASFANLFTAIDDPSNVNLRQSKQQLLSDLNNIESLLGTTSYDAGRVVDAQVNLVRSIAAFLKLVPASQLAQFQNLLVAWVTKFTSLAQASETVLQGTVDLLNLAGATAAQLKRVKARADDFVAKVRDARAALGSLVVPTPTNLTQIVELLNRFSLAASSLEEAIEILPLPANQIQSLKQAGAQLDTYVGQVETAINQVNEVYNSMRALANAAPLILQSVINQEIDELYAPYSSYVADIEERAIDITALLLANVARFAAGLLARLETPASEFSNLLELSHQIEQTLASLLAPQAIELSYTWSPVLGNSPGNVFELEDNNGNNLLVTVRVVSYVAFNAPPRPPEYAIKGRLERFKINLLGGSLNFITIIFDHLEFTSATGAQPHCDVKIKDVQFGQALTFVQKLQSILNPSDGPYLQITPLQLIAGFRYAVPAFSTGGFSLRNLRFDASLTLPFTGDPARFQFKISDRDNPCILSVGIFGGGMWFSLILGLDGVDETELAMEFGLAGDISIGIATGYGRVMGGIYIHYKRGIGTELAGFIDIAGHVDVLGLISVSLSVYYGLRRLSSGQCYGEATITVKIEMFFFDIEVHLHTEKQFAGDSAQASPQAAAIDGGSLTVPDTNQTETEDRELDWDKYAEAFAEA